MYRVENMKIFYRKDRIQLTHKYKDNGNNVKWEKSEGIAKYADPIIKINRPIHLTFSRYTIEC